MIVQLTTCNFNPHRNAYKPTMFLFWLFSLVTQKHYMQYNIITTKQLKI